MSVNRASEVWKEIKPFALRDLKALQDSKNADSAVNSGYYIILYDVSAQKLKYYSATSTGLHAALAASATGDIVFLPACTINNEGSSFTPGDEISTGAITVTSEAGHEISGLTPGQWYAVESWNGYFKLGIPFPQESSKFQLSDGDGYSGYVGQNFIDDDYLTSPDFCSFSEMYVGGDGKNYGRTYFLATTESIWIRVQDDIGYYGDNSGTLSWRLRTAIVALGNIIPAGVEVAGLGENCIINGTIENNGMLTNVKVTGAITGTGSYHAYDSDSAWKTNKQVISNVPDGNPPFEIASTDLNFNLNADLLDGLHANELHINFRENFAGNMAGPNLRDIAPAGFITKTPNSHAWKIGPISSVTLPDNTYEVYGFYDVDGYVCIAVRTIPGEWTVYTTANQFVADGDGHNFISVGLDKNGFIHIAYDMHGDPLIYRRSTVPIDQFTGTLTGLLPMLGTNEDFTSYPGFFKDPLGELYFMFRHDTGLLPHAYGDTYLYKFNTATVTWEAANGTGSGGMLIEATTDTDLAYHIEPVFDADFGSGGKMHFFWTIYVDGAHYNNLYYMAWNGTSWTKISGAAQTIPAMSGNGTAADVLSGDDAQPSAIGQMAYSDSGGHPHLVYFREDGDSYYHLYHLWHNGTAWVKLALTQVPNTADNSRGIWTAVVIDRNTDTVVVVYTDHGEGDSKIRILTSKPGDFTSWTKAIIYNEETDLVNIGSYQPKIDRIEWERSKRLMIPIEQWGVSGSQPIYLLEYIPSDWGLFDAVNYPDLHANDADTALGIHHTLGTGENQAAAGDHTHDTRYYTESEVDALIAAIPAGGSGELLMQDGVTSPPVPVENEAETDWLYEG